MKNLSYILENNDFRIGNGDDLHRDDNQERG